MTTRSLIDPRPALILLVAWLCAGTAQAQFSGPDETITIDGVTSNWVGDYFVGSNYTTMF